LQPQRVAVIASHTFTQLVRMKVFYFLVIFTIIMVVSRFLNLPMYQGPEAVAENELRMLKDTALGAMKLFSIVFAVVATALLLPKDVEDRTLYTILAKPVPRLDYLAGKLLGVLALVFVSLLLMDLLMTVVLALRAHGVLTEQMALADARGWPQDVRDAVRMEVERQGATWNLQAGVFALFLQAAVIAAMALLISTFSTSTLFTAILTVMVYFIGFLQADAREVWLHAGRAGIGTLGKSGMMIVAVVFPDFQLFNVVDAAVQGQAVTLLAIAKLTGLSALYAAVYTILSWFVFADKEF
jgi:hypothetical protein